MTRIDLPAAGSHQADPTGEIPPGKETSLWLVASDTHRMRCYHDQQNSRQRHDDAHSYELCEQYDHGPQQPADSRQHYDCEHREQNQEGIHRHHLLTVRWPLPTGEHAPDCELPGIGEPAGMLRRRAGRACWQFTGGCADLMSGAKARGPDLEGTEGTEDIPVASRLGNSRTLACKIHCPDGDCTAASLWLRRDFVGFSPDNGVHGRR